MKKIYLVLLAVLPCLVYAQPGPTGKEQRDSIAYYQRELGRIYRETMDSVRRSETYTSIMNNLERLTTNRNEYAAMVIFMDVFHSGYDQFNAMLAQDGFAPLNDLGYRLGFGFSGKSNHMMFDIAFMAIGFDNKTTKENEKVTTNLSNLFTFDLGYDLLNKSTISIYPYAGLGLRLSNIRYLKNDVANPNYTSITNMISDGEHLTLTSTRLGYQLGVGFDFTLSQNSTKTAKTILFLKAGMNRPVWKDKYKYNDLPEYNTGIKQGDWMITVGFKFAGS